LFSCLIKRNLKKYIFLYLAIKMSFSRPRALFLEVEKRIFLDECTTEILIHL
jgi:hypothetical protein